MLGRAQHYLGGGRLGYEVTLAAPALRDQFWFADGERGDGITETFSIYNPTDADVEVDAVFLGLPVDANFGEIPPIAVPSRRVVVFDPSADEIAGRIPDGRHAVVFSTLAEPSIVVERVAHPAGRRLGRHVGRRSAHRRARTGSSPPSGISASARRCRRPDALVVYNVDNVEGTITIEALGPGGPTPIDGLTDIPIGPGAVITIDLESPDALDTELILKSTNRVFVERSLPRG